MPNNTLVEGTDYFINSQGLVELLAAYHLKRGYCCGNGCKHCPYQYQNVKEPLKTQLLSAQKLTKNSQK